MMKDRIENPLNRVPLNCAIFIEEPQSVDKTRVNI